MYSAVDADGGHFAVKRMLGAAPDQIVAIEREIKCMSRLKQNVHKNILGLLGVAQYPASAGAPADFQVCIQYPDAHLENEREYRYLGVYTLYSQGGSLAVFSISC